MMQKILLISESTVKDLSLIQLNVDGKVLAKTILEVQFIHLRPILGNDLYQKVLDDVSSKAADGSYVMVYKTLLEDYIQPYLAHATLQDWIINSTYKMTNKGILKYSDSQATALGSDEIEYAKNYHDNKVASYKKALICYLEENKLVESCNTDTDITSEATGWYLSGMGRCIC